MSASTVDTQDLERRLRRARIVPVVRVADAEDARRLVERLLLAGIDVIELTTTIGGWQEMASTIRVEHPEVCGRGGRRQQSDGTRRRRRPRQGGVRGVKRALCAGECMVELTHTDARTLRPGFAGDTYNTAV